MVDKGKFGTIEPIGYSRKYNSIRSIQMVTVFRPGLPESDLNQVAPRDSLQLQMSDLGK